MTTLNSLVNETTKIKDDLVTCHANLKDNLIEKGVECSDSDKLPNLINKIKKLYNIEEHIKLRLFSCIQSRDAVKMYEHDPDTLYIIRTVDFPSNSILSGIGGGYDGHKLRLFSCDADDGLPSVRGQGKIYEHELKSSLNIKKTRSAPDCGISGIGGGYDGHKLRLFSCDSYSDKIYEHDPNSLTVIKTVSTSRSPEGIGGGYDGHKLRLFYSDRENIYEIDPDSLNTIKTLTPPANALTGVGGGFDGNKLRLFYSDEYTDKIYEVDPDSVTVIKSNGYSIWNAGPSGIGGGHDVIKTITIDNIKYELNEV